VSVDPEQNDLHLANRAEALSPHLGSGESDSWLQEQTSEAPFPSLWLLAHPGLAFKSTATSDAHRAGIDSQLFPYVTVRAFRGSYPRNPCLELRRRREDTHTDRTG
jgi:hypothetical protein